MGSLVSGLSERALKGNSDRRSLSPRNSKSLQRKFACWPGQNALSHRFQKSAQGDCHDRRGRCTRQFPEVYDLCHTFLRAILACPCVLLLAQRAKNVLQSLISRATAYAAP